MKEIAWDEPKGDLEAGDIAAVREWRPLDLGSDDVGSNKGSTASSISGGPHRPTGHHIDWLAYTVPSEVGLHNAIYQDDFMYVVGEPRHNLQGYDRTVTLSHGSLAYHSRLPKQGIHVLLKGADLGALAADGGEVIPIIRHAISHGANITRLDFAIDYFGPAAPEELHQAWRAGDLTAPVHKVRLSQTDERTKGGVSSGFTTYIGSPYSVRCLRVYDKAAKCGLPGPWTRLELRCAPPYGRRLAVAMLQYGIPDAGKQAIRDFVSCTVPWFVDATQGPSVDLPPAVEKKRDPKRWLLEDVLPVFVSTLALEESIGSVELRNAYLAPLLVQSPRLRKAA